MRDGPVHHLVFSEDWSSTYTDWYLFAPVWGISPSFQAAWNHCTWTSQLVQARAILLFPGNMAFKMLGNTVVREFIEKLLSVWGHATQDMHRSTKGSLNSQCKGINFHSFALYKYSFLKLVCLKGIKQIIVLCFHLYFHSNLYKERGKPC